MIGLVRAATLCATLLFGLAAAEAADKAFRRDDLADSAIKLEAQIKSEAGAVSKPAASLRADADAAFKRNDYRTGLRVLGQIAATTPEDSANWLRLARVIFQIVPASGSEQTFLWERASTAAYLAYQRTTNPAQEAEALAVLGRSMAERKASPSKRRAFARPISSQSSACLAGSDSTATAVRRMVRRTCPPVVVPGCPRPR